MYIYICKYICIYISIYITYVCIYVVYIDILAHNFFKFCDCLKKLFEQQITLKML